MAVVRRGRAHGTSDLEFLPTNFLSLRNNYSIMKSRSKWKTYGRHRGESDCCSNSVDGWNENHKPAAFLEQGLGASIQNNTPVQNFHSSDPYNHEKQKHLIVFAIMYHITYLSCLSSSSKKRCYNENLTIPKSPSACFPDTTALST